jgi:hypothetical protein
MTRAEMILLGPRHTLRNRLDVRIGECPAAAGAGPHQLPGASEAARRLPTTCCAVSRRERDLDGVGLRRIGS